QPSKSHRSPLANVRSYPSPARRGADKTEDRIYAGGSFGTWKMSGDSAVRQRSTGGSPTRPVEASPRSIPTHAGRMEEPGRQQGQPWEGPPQSGHGSAMAATGARSVRTARRTGTRSGKRRATDASYISRTSKKER